MGDETTGRKVVVVIGDGMADRPLERLGGLTPLEAAQTPNMDSMARAGAVGLTANVPRGMEPGSDVAIMSIMGYDPAKYYTGRGPIEAASMRVPVMPGETAFRCNLINVDGDELIDYSGGHIETEESGELIRALKTELENEDAVFHHGVSFRNLLMMRGDFSGLRTHAPHDHMNEPWKEYLPSGPGADSLIGLIERSREILENHEINARRRAAGKRAANMIWPWSGGRLPEMEPYGTKFGLSGAVVSAVDLVQGLGVCAGLEVVRVPGATGLVDTNYEGKVAATLKALEKHDFALIHIEGIDEAAHMADMELKMEGIRRFDRLVVGPLADSVSKYEDYLLLLLPDHPTPIEVRTHTADPVPFIAVSSRPLPNRNANSFSEKQAAATGLRVEHGHTLLGLLLDGKLA